MDHQKVFVRQANTLRKNLYEWDQVLRDSTGEDWPSMLGRLNAAMNQINNLDNSIDDIMNHFVYEPRKSTANPQDIPLFLSVRLVDESKRENEKDEKEAVGGKDGDASSDPVEVLNEYEKRAAIMANKFAESMVRY